MTVHGGEKAIDWQSHWADVLQEQVFYLVTCCVKNSSDGSALNDHRKNLTYINAHVSFTVRPAQELWYTRLHSVTSQKPHNIVCEPSNPRSTCCSTAGKTRHTHGGLSFSDPILQCWQRNLSMFICQSAVSIVVFILQMRLHNIYVLVLLSLTGFPTVGSEAGTRQSQI